MFELQSEQQKPWWIHIDYNGCSEKIKLSDCWHNDIVDKLLRLYSWWLNVKFTVKLFSIPFTTSQKSKQKESKKLSWNILLFYSTLSQMPDTNERNEPKYCAQIRAKVFVVFVKSDPLTLLFKAFLFKSFRNVQIFEKLFLLPILESWMGKCFGTEMEIQSSSSSFLFTMQ